MTINVLYVDDEDLLLEIGRQFLEDEGDIQVNLTNSAENALNLLSVRPFDVIISDYQMPDMDGIEFLKHLKERNLMIPFIIFTGRGREEIVIEALNNGADFYLQKGGDPKILFAELTNMVRQAYAKKKAESDLKGEIAFTNLVLNTVASLIVVLDLDGKIIRWNQACAVLSGYSEDEVKTKIFWDFLLLPEERNEVHQVFMKLVAGEFPQTYEKTWIIKDGSRRLISWENSCLNDGNGSIHYVMSTGLDITAQRRTDAALSMVNKKLNLLNSITRHDILNKIQALRGYLDLMGDEPLSVYALEYHSKSSEILDILIRQIVFTREFQNLGINPPSWIDLSALLMPYLESDISISVNLKDLFVFADPMISKVFSNLYHNSKKHGAHVKNIDIRYELLDADLMIIWEDNGLGIPESEKEKIFTWGYGRDSGMGLFLSQDILGITGLSMRERGILGSGARFEIIVPRGMYSIKNPL